MAESDILYRKQARVGIATFNRPAVLNALRQATLTRLLTVLDDAASDDALRALVLTGTGRAFSAGIDLKEWGDGGIGGSDPETRRRLERTQEITRRLVGHPKIIIAAVNGLAVGMGAELCVAADIRIAADDARFAFPEVKRALFETNGVTYLLPRLVGLGRATQWLLSGEMISASDALAGGLVTGTVPPDRLLEFAVGIGEAIAANAPVSVRLVKQALRRGYEVDFESMLQYEVEGVMTCMQTEDFAEGIRAFIEKRSPVYGGR